MTRIGGGGESERVNQGVVHGELSSDGVLGKESAGVVGISRTGRAGVGIEASAGMEGVAERGFAGDVVVGGGGVVLGAVDPTEGGAEVEE